MKPATIQSQPLEKQSLKESKQELREERLDSGQREKHNYLRKNTKQVVEVTDRWL